MKYLLLTLLLSFTLTTMSKTQNFIPANHKYIHYSGRWDKSDSLSYRYSWSGVYISAEFTGTSIGVRLNDNISYFNVYIDGKLHSVFHGDKQGTADYIIADNLKNTKHTFLLSKRNISFDIFSFSGLILDENSELLLPAGKPKRKIEFIGDSFTAAESNEATAQEVPWEERFPVTNIDKGFAPLIAKHFNAQYTTTCRSGIGMVCDWQGDSLTSMPYYFNRTLMEAPEPEWDFSRWIPDVVVICLGLNDMSGLKDSTGEISKTNSEIYRQKYHEFLDTVRSVYPGVKIVAVAAHPEWIKTNVKQVVEEEKKSGNSDIYYSQFDEYPGGYVANGHPTVETHRKIADQIIMDMEEFNFFVE